MTGVEASRGWSNYLKAAWVNYLKSDSLANWSSSNQMPNVPTGSGISPVVTVLHPGQSETLIHRLAFSQRRVLAALPHLVQC